MPDDPDETHDSDFTYDSSNSKRNRTFGRWARQYHAQSSPFARPRDVNGNSRQRPVAYDGPIPAKGELIRTHGIAIAQIGATWPMRAAVLTDIVGRVDKAIDTHTIVVLEEEETRHKLNEEAAELRVMLDSKIDELRRKRDEVQAEQDGLIKIRRDTLANARLQLAEQLALHNIPVPIRNWGANDDSAVQENSPEIFQSPAPSPKLGGDVDESPLTVREKFTLTPWLKRLTKSNVVDTQSVASLSAATTVSGEARQAEADSRSLAFPDPVAVNEPFPIQEGREHARPGLSFVLQRGLPTVSPSAEIFNPVEPWLKPLLPIAQFLVTVASGAIFGLSIGLLLTILSPKFLALGGRSAYVAFVICGAFGIAMFWSIGITIQSLASLAAEEWFTQLTAATDQNRDGLTLWFKRAGIWSAAVATTAVIILVSIEATVERNGIVKLFIENATNVMLLGHQAVQRAPDAISTLCLCLIASVPFVLLHATQGWTTARSRVLLAYGAACHEEAAWTRAQELHRYRVEIRQASADKYHQVRLDDFERERQLYTSSQTHGQFESTQQPPDEISDDDVQDNPIPADTSFLDHNIDNTVEEPLEGEIVFSKDLPPDTDHGSDDPTSAYARMVGFAERGAKLALANEHAREAYAWLREAYGRRREVLTWYNNRLDELEQSRRPEMAEPTQEGRRRIEDAYNNILGAVTVFDAAFARDAKAYELWAAGGLWWKIKAYFFRAPESMSVAISERREKPRSTDSDRA